MDTCPHCHRRLLSHISVRCNWCGTEITDPAYLAQAEVERATSRAEDALHSLQSLTVSPTTEQYSRFGQVRALLGLPTPSRQDAMFAQHAEYEACEQIRQAAVLHAQLYAQQQRASQTGQGDETLAEEHQTEAHDRFGHLEL